MEVDSDDNWPESFYESISKSIRDLQDPPAPPKMYMATSLVEVLSDLSIYPKLPAIKYPPMPMPEMASNFVELMSNLLSRAAAVSNPESIYLTFSGISYPTPPRLAVPEMASNFVETLTELCASAYGTFDFHDANPENEPFPEVSPSDEADYCDCTVFDQLVATFFGDLCSI
ncbi:unnamed protein product [Caenorhabditis auriculariae]|uniref:Uncharacterized protein n=1 Tax=Caenorhabditis auriculariae TaxID=2777116 RepID=A0A8S1HMQ1_9PELO|nr:unnamed protein product [Caenorhabditis auriculariae]